MIGRFLAAAGFILAAFPALAGHGLHEGEPVVMQKTMYCVEESDATAVMDVVESSGSSDAVMVLYSLNMPHPSGMPRCGVGRGEVVPVEHIRTVTDPEGIDVHMIRAQVIMPGGVADVFLLGTLPFIDAGQPI